MKAAFHRLAFGDTKNGRNRSVYCSLRTLEYRHSTFEALLSLKERVFTDYYSGVNDGGYCVGAKKDSIPKKRMTIVESW